MAPPKGISILPLVATLPAVILASAWLYQRVKPQKPSADTKTETTQVQDALINKEIGINKIDAAIVDRRLLSKRTITIAYASTTGTCASYAKKLHQTLTVLNSLYTIQLVKVAEVDWWDEMVNNEDEESTSSDATGNPPILLFVLPTWTDGTLPPESQIIIRSLEEISSDWRVAPEPLKGKSSVRIGAFGYVTL